MSVHRQTSRPRSTVRPVIADCDYLWGLGAIARHIGKYKSNGAPDVRAVAQMVHSGIVPATRVGHRLILGRKSEIDAAPGLRAK